MNRATGLAIVTGALLASLAAASYAQVEQTPPAVEVSPADVMQQPPRSSRLRFRSKGPTCMCVNGLSEADIEATERERNNPTADPQSSGSPDQ